GPLAALAAGRSVVAGGAALGRRPLGHVEALAHGAEGDLALRVDVLDHDLDGVTQVDHVLDAVDALATAELGDVDQAVPAREDVDEGTELGDVDHLAGV